jgi:RHS repeat-associated protein
MVTDRLYTGQRWEASLGLYDYRARFYDPTLGRFLQPDPIVPEPGNPQALNRYAYVYNNPLRYTDPTGHCPWCIAIGFGVLIGAGVSYGVQVAANISQNGLTVQAFTHVNWAAVGAGAVAGAVGVATFGVGTAVLGTSLAGMMAAGAASGAVAGQAAIATENVLSGREITEGLGHPSDIARDAVAGAVLAGVGRSIDIALIRARYPGYYSRYISEAELQAIQETGLLRGGRPKETYFTINRFETAKEATSRLALPSPPQYRVDFQIVNQPHILGPQRVRPWIRPIRSGFRAGFGIEYWTTDPVKVRIIHVERLK